MRHLVAAAPNLVSFSGVVAGRSGALASSLGALPKQGTVRLCSAVRSWYLGFAITPAADIAALCRALEASTTVESLHLENARLGCDNEWAARRVATMLAVNTSLRSLTVVELIGTSGVMDRGKSWLRDAAAARPVPLQLQLSERDPDRDAD